MSQADFDHTQLDSVIFFQTSEYACLLFVSPYATGAVEYHSPDIPPGTCPCFTTMIIVSLVVSLIVWLLRR
jgi:hypothetical protein